MNPGMFITLEGIDGCGKTTQLRLLASWLRERGRNVVETVEPGGTEIGREIRKILLDPANASIRPRTELLLYFASRAQNVEQVIRPALTEGAIVLCDRFTDSTLVYQGCGRGLDPAIVLDLHRIACGTLQPNITLLIDVDIDTSLARARRRNDHASANESRIDEEARDFHERVRRGYMKLAAKEPNRFIVIDGMHSIGDVAARIHEAMENRV
jgi:dTMP kinase